MLTIESNVKPTVAISARISSEYSKLLVAELVKMSLIARKPTIATW
jgi:hypothetical protein